MIGLENAQACVDYIVDTQTHQNCNAAAQNCWDVYWGELFSELGVSARRHHSLASWLKDEYKAKVLCLGRQDVSATEAKALEAFVGKGGVLIASLTAGIDALCGIELGTWCDETDDCYSVQGLYTTLGTDEKLPFFGPQRRITPLSDVCVHAFLSQPSSFFMLENTLEDTGVPGLVQRNIGNGRVYYFPFSLPQTVCVLHQGRPVDRDWDGDGYYRTGDGIALGQCYDVTVPNADHFLDVLRGVLDDLLVPCIWTLPPVDGRAAELALHFGGDDEYDLTAPQLPAAHQMKELGLPYHINITPSPARDGFALNIENWEELQALDCECSIHFDFFKIRTFFSEDDVHEQLDLYERVYGHTPVCSVNHVMMWTGWTDFPRWCARRGMKGDASRINVFMVPDPNPINSFGMAYGTGYPHFVMDDWKHKNQMLDFAYLPVMLYEPRVRAERRMEDIARLRGVLDKARQNGWPLNVFVHPVYIARNEACVEALREILCYEREKNLRCVHFGTDAACLWWHERARCTVRPAGSEYHVRAQREGGVVIRLPIGLQGKVYVDGKEAEAETRDVRGYPCRLVCVPQGEHLLTVGNHAG